MKRCWALQNCKVRKSAKSESPSFRLLLRQYIRMYILRIDRLARKDDQPLHHIAQFADITRPVMFFQSFERFLVDGFFGNAIICTDIGEKFVDEQRNIIAAIVERRHMDDDNAEAVI